MSTHHRWIVALLTLSALTACATTAPPGARSVPLASAAAVPTQRVYVTGSHIAVPVDPHTGLPETASPMQTVTHDDLSNCGRLDLASALRELVPALH